MASRLAVFCGVFVLAVGLSTAVWSSVQSTFWPPWYENLGGETPGLPTLSLEIDGQPWPHHTLVVTCWTSLAGADVWLLVGPQAAPKMTNGGWLHVGPSLLLKQPLTPYGVASWVAPIEAPVQSFVAQVIVRIGSVTYLSNAVKVKPEKQP